MKSKITIAMAFLLATSSFAKAQLLLQAGVRGMIPMASMIEQVPAILESPTGFEAQNEEQYNLGCGSITGFAGVHTRSECNLNNDACSVEFRYEQAGYRGWSNSGNTSAWVQDDKVLIKLNQAFVNHQKVCLGTENQNGATVRYIKLLQE